jgi:hypothetical protein
LDQVASARHKFLESPLLGEGALVEAAFAAGAIESATKIADATGKQVVRAFAFQAMGYVFSMVSWIFRMIGYQ